MRGSRSRVILLAFALVVGCAALGAGVIHQVWPGKSSIKIAQSSTNSPKTPRTNDPNDPASTYINDQTPSEQSTSEQSKAVKAAADEQNDASGNDLASTQALSRASTQTRNTSFEVVAFYMRGWSSQTYGYPSLTSHYKYFQTVAPFWYTVDSDGSVVTRDYEAEVTSFVNNHPGLKITPLINNGSNILQMLSNSSLRSRAVNNIVNLVQENGFSGVDIDFELLPPAAKEGMTAFIRELSDRLKQNGKLLSVCVMPKAGGGLEEISAAYDYSALAQSADYLVMMTYDRHSDSSDPGSLAPIDWVKENIDYALQFVAPSKLVVGIADYGYDWPAYGGQVQSLGEKEIMAIAYQYGTQVQWDDTSQSPHFTYWPNGTQHTIWFENGNSVSAKVAAAKSKGIRGVSIWRIGYETEDYWTTLNAAIGR